LADYLVVRKVEYLERGVEMKSGIHRVERVVAHVQAFYPRIQRDGDHLRTDILKGQCHDINYFVEGFKNQISTVFKCFECLEMYF
jgi:hypothetical protein